MENTKTEWEKKEEEWEKKFRIRFYEEITERPKDTSYISMRNFISSTIKAREREVIEDILKLQEDVGPYIQRLAVDVEAIEEYSKRLH